MMTEILSSVEITPAEQADACVIWLHGLGADGHDFEPVVPALNLPPELSVRFVFPHAPQQPVTINGGIVMRAWYDILEASLDRRIDLAGVDRSVERINTLIEREIGLGIPPSRIILAGFSQGGVIALEAAMHSDHKFAGVIALSTYLADPSSVPRGSLPIFMGHGTFDPIVPLALGENAAQTLTRSGYEVSWHTWPMEHSVNMEEIAEIGRWITDRLK